MTIRASLTAAAVCSLLFTGAAYADPISEQAVIDAQTAWGEGIVAIAAMHADGGDLKASLGFAVCRKRNGIGQ